MKMKRQVVENATSSGEQHSKKQKLIEISSTSPPQVGFDNALFQLATHVDEDDKDSEKVEENSLNNHEQEEEDGEDEDHNNEFGKASNRMIEIHRDCPYQVVKVIEVVHNQWPQKENSPFARNIPIELTDHEARTGVLVANEEILGFTMFFNDELTLDNISRPRLVNMCKHMGIQPYGTDAYLRYMLRKILQWGTKLTWSTVIDPGGSSRQERVKGSSILRSKK